MKLKMSSYLLAHHYANHPIYRKRVTFGYSKPLNSGFANAMNIRAYTPSDKKACMAIFESNIPRYFMEEEHEPYSEWLDKKDREGYWVLTDHGEIVACGGIFEDTELKQVGLAWGMVRQDLHNQGYGKALTLHRIAEMEAHFAHYDQHLGTSQHTAAFYEKMGFQTTEVIKDGYGPGMDHYKMMRTARRK